MENNKHIVPYETRRSYLESEFPVQPYLTAIQDRIGRCIMSGVEMFRATFTDINVPDQSDDISAHAWLLAVKTSKYNATYFISRDEAIKATNFTKEYGDVVDRIGESIDSLGGPNPIINYALHKFVIDFSQSTHNGKVIEHNDFIPLRAIQAHDASTIAIRSRGPLTLNPTDSFNANHNLYDWHDLAHYIAAAASSGYFGAKYHQGLNKLEKEYQDLVTGNDKDSGFRNIFSDGIIFTHLSRPVFEDLVSHHPEILRSEGVSDDEVRNQIAGRLVAYFVKGEPLFHPIAQKYISPTTSISPIQLAICMQNKRYERTAAELEKYLLVRGSPDGTRGDIKLDPLSYLSRSQRIHYIANLGKLSLYFENRNLIRHRAHEDALATSASELLAKGLSNISTEANNIEKSRIYLDIDLLKKIINFYNFDDIKRGQEINLFKEVEANIQSRRLLQ